MLPSAPGQGKAATGEAATGENTFGASTLFATARNRETDRANRPADGRRLVARASAGGGHSNAQLATNAVALKSVRG